MLFVQPGINHLSYGYAAASGSMTRLSASASDTQFSPLMGAQSMLMWLGLSGILWRF